MFMILQREKSQNGILNGHTIPSTSHRKNSAIISEQSGEDLIITYKDNGIGMAQEEKNLIFKQGHGKNTGMGFFLIREILGLTNITIRECGVPGEGVRFEMKIPKSEWRMIS